ncbi:hypothetical protein HaLaN_15933 [Haematococcus lacustris]|uniref:Uncharacterized protein n=1 Tax=Haematococcus lacustris TaxID=44745 RepID=A0A699ZIY4_HAELA|nr:hypothetical protein HaLaN_15933 [Haematococcus lacustris]
MSCGICSGHAHVWRQPSDMQKMTCKRDFVFEDGACVNARLHTSSGFTPTRPDSGRAALGDRTTELWHSYYEARKRQLRGSKSRYGRRMFLLQGVLHGIK